MHQDCGDLILQLPFVEKYSSLQSASTRHEAAPAESELEQFSVEMKSVVQVTLHTPSLHSVSPQITSKASACHKAIMEEQGTNLQSALLRCIVQSPHANLIIFPLNRFAKIFNLNEN